MTDNDHTAQERVEDLLERIRSGAEQDWEASACKLLTHYQELRRRHELRAEELADVRTLVDLSRRLPALGDLPPGEPLDWSGWPRVPIPHDAEIGTLGELALWLGGGRDSFTGRVLDLCAKAERTNILRLYTAFPHIVAAWLSWARPAKWGFPTSGELLERLRGAPGAVQRATVNPDGDALAELNAVLMDTDAAVVMAAVIHSAGGEVEVAAATIAGYANGQYTIHAAADEDFTSARLSVRPPAPLPPAEPGR